MPGKKKMKGSGKNGCNIPPSATAYTGPILPKDMGEANDCYVIALRLCNTVASNASGLITTVFDWSAQAQAAQNWTNLAAVFAEYRILGMQVTLFPVNPLNVAATQFPIFTVIDRDTASPLTSLQDAASRPSCNEHTLMSTIKREVKMNSVEEAQWCDVSTTLGNAQKAYIKLYGSGLANSTTYYQYLNTVLVQFRGLK